MTDIPVGLIEFLDLSPDLPTIAKHARSRAAARLADRLGYRRLWIPEHHGKASPSASPLLLAAAVAAETQRIRVGTAVTLLRIRDPYLTAVDVFHSAVISGGRLDVGLGRGHFGGVGSEVLARVQKSDEEYERAVAEFLGYLDGASPLLDGVGEDVERWMHGTGTRSAELAAEHGLSYCHALFLNPDLDACAEGLRRFRKYQTSAGRTAVALALVANDDPRRAARDAARLSYVANCVGDAETCARVLLRVLRHTGADEVLFYEASAETGHHMAALEAVDRAVQRMAREQKDFSRAHSI